MGLIWIDEAALAAVTAVSWRLIEGVASQSHRIFIPHQSAVLEDGLAA